MYVGPGSKRDHGFHAENHVFWGPITFGPQFCFPWLKFPRVILTHNKKPKKNQCFFTSCLGCSEPLDNAKVPGWLKNHLKKFEKSFNIKIGQSCNLCSTNNL